MTKGLSMGPFEEVVESRFSGKPLSEGYANFEILPPEQTASMDDSGYNQWEFKIRVPDEETGNRIFDAKQPANIGVEEVDVHRGVVTVYVWVSDYPNAAAARRGLEQWLVKVAGSQKSLF